MLEGERSDIKDISLVRPFGVVLLVEVCCSKFLMKVILHRMEQDVIQNSQYLQENHIQVQSLVHVNV